MGAINMADLLADGGDINVQQTGEYLIILGRTLRHSLFSPLVVVVAVAMVTVDVTMGATGSGIATAGNIDVINQSVIEPMEVIR